MNGAHAVVIGAMISAFACGCIVILSVIESTQPLSLVTINDRKYIESIVPVFVRVKDGVLLLLVKVVVVPCLMVHKKVSPVGLAWLVKPEMDVLTRFSVSGSQPADGRPVKLAVGNA